ncbi:hypothetical protein Zm00014a_021504 [Zea mays]|uniref:Uncharacterized protein n=1 Tax=Zea mays TaxID=4577 RepID=A0A3L6G9W0_MAIZE|nr:hypothetical protein Zm00014a_021504 [Zea mays]
MIVTPVDVFCIPFNEKNTTQRCGDLNNHETWWRCTSVSNHIFPNCMLHVENRFTCVDTKKLAPHSSNIILIKSGQQRMSQRAGVKD